MSVEPSPAAMDADSSSVRSCGFSRDPFADSASGEIYFENEHAAELLSRVVHLVDYTQLLLFVQGAADVGKSTFLQRLVAQGGSDWRVATVRAGAAATVGAFLSSVAEGLGAAGSVAGGENALDQFVDFATSASVRGVTLVLMVDDAETLNSAEAEAVALVATPVDGGRPLLRVVLFGETLPRDFGELLPKSEDGGVLLQVMPLPALDEGDVRDYLRWRLAMVGWTGEFPFTPAKVAEIYALSKGLFVNVNRLAAAELGGEVGQSVAPVSAADFTAPQTKQPYISARVLILATAMLTAIGVWVNYRQPPPEPVSLSVLTSPAPVVAPVPVPAPSPVPVLVPVPANTPTPVVEAPLSPATGSDWVRLRDPSHFTLQYAAVVTMEGAQQFAAKHGLNDAVIYRVNRGGREWSVVIAGDFADMKSAQLAALGSPASLVKSKPWARRFGVLQAELAGQGEATKTPP